MRKILFVIFAGLILTACGSKKVEEQQEAEQDSMAVETSETVESLINNLEEEFDSDSTASEDTVGETAE